MSSPPLRVLLLACIVTVGILGCEGDSGGPADEPKDVAPIVGPDSVGLDCYSTDLTVSIHGGTAEAWLLGFARESQGWVDEGCRDDGDVCHTLDADGGVIQQSGDFCDDPADGQSCIPGGYHYAGVMTYVLKPEVGVGCWAWGADVGYYASLDCSTPSGWADSCG